MPTKLLPESASIDHLKHQAKDLLLDFRASKIDAFQRIREFHPKFSEVPDTVLAVRSFSLSDAQLSIAGEYGYASWPRLKAVIADKQHEELQLTHNERLPEGPFKQALDFMDAGDEARLRQHLVQNPGLVHEKASFEGGNYFSNPTLIEFLPENPTRQGSLPQNAMAIAEIILDAGAKENTQALNETVMLAASGRVCRECNIQRPLIKLLCSHGADPATGMHSALAHGEFDAVRVLVECGAPYDLPAASTLDDYETVERIAKSASEDQLQLSLALAANFAGAKTMRILLESGADPNRYNPPGGHSHCTPLHSAVASDQFDAVVALVDGGADLSMTDIHHKMTALGWAEYMKRERIVEYLKSKQEP